ncbi:hypothetical protein GOZ93_16920 [Agrobacterium vitis]|uniref:hypothetical protein n=1 Tax=Agrobacterium vitis TaxID=373 RepID=UPI0012E78CB5|nr:hypothetical protein [Agrobacterium vitis]MUZ83915.1 hypothetical protein [Agrobacterium vitis]
MTARADQPRRKPVFRIRFRDGHTVTTAASTSLKAEQKALRIHPGFVQSIRIIKKGSANA